MHAATQLTRGLENQIGRANAGLSAPMPLSDVQSQVLRLEESIHYLESTVATLITRLDPVLTPDRLADAKGSGDAAVRSADTALSQQLHVSCNRVEGLQARISEVTARLGI